MDSGKALTSLAVCSDMFTNITILAKLGLCMICVLHVICTHLNIYYIILLYALYCCTYAWKWSYMFEDWRKLESLLGGNAIAFTECWDSKRMLPQERHALAMQSNLCLQPLGCDMITVSVTRSDQLALSKAGETSPHRKAASCARVPAFCTWCTDTYPQELPSLSVVDFCRCSLSRIRSSFLGMHGYTRVGQQVTWWVGF